MEGITGVWFIPTPSIGSNSEINLTKNYSISTWNPSVYRYFTVERLVMVALG